VEQCDTLRRCREPDGVSHLDKLSQGRGMGILTPLFFTYIMLILRVEVPTACVIKLSFAYPKSLSVLRGISVAVNVSGGPSDEV